MKTNKKLILKCTAIVLLISMIATFTQCMPQRKMTFIPSSSKEIEHGPAKKTEGQLLNEVQAEVGVKNFEQILYTMAAVTGIGIDELTDNTIDTYIMRVYNEVKTSLPTDNNIKTFTSVQQAAVTKLAAEFCWRLTTIDFTEHRERLWPGSTFDYDYSNRPSVAFTQAKRDIFINQTIDAFWGGAVSDEERELAVQELNLLIVKLINNEDKADTTQRAVRGACTAALSSAYVTIL